MANDVTLHVGIDAGSLKKDIENAIASANATVAVNVDFKGLKEQLTTELQINVDQNYLRSQVQKALNDLGKFVNGNGSGKPIIKGRLFDMNIKGDAASYNKLLSTLKEVGKLQSSLEGTTSKDASTLGGKLAATTSEINQLAEAAKSGKMSLEEFNRQKASIEKNVANYSGGVDNVLAAEKQAAKEAAQAAREKANIEKQAAAEAKQAAAEAKQAAKAKATEERQAAKEFESAEALRIKQLDLEAQAYQKVISARKFLDQARRAKGSNEYNAYQEQIQVIENSRQALHDGSMGYDEARKNIAGANTEMKKLEDSMRRSGQVSNTLSDKLQRFKQHVTTISSIVNAFRILSRVIRPVVQAVTEVDTAMTQLKIVTNESDTAMQSYAQNIMKVADQTAGSVKDLINSTTTFARLGFSLGESTDLAKYTQMLENVGDIDEADATSAITSIVKAFDVKTDELESVMDRMVNVGKNWLPKRIVICA